MPGGFKFSVQRVNDGAVAHRPSAASQSRGAMVFNSRWVEIDRSVPVDKDWRSNLLACSLVPRCQGL